MTGAIDVLVLGGAGVDTVVPVPVLPVPLADSYPVSGIVTRAGQTGDNVALGLHTLGLRCRHLDLVGRDPEGDLVRAWHERHQVPFASLPTAAGTKRAVNLVDPGGRRLSFYDAGRVDADERFPADLLAAAAGPARHVHVSITQPGQHAIAGLAGPDRSVSTDLHDWDGTNPYHLLFADHADLVFLSAAALDDPESTMHRVLARGRARVVVATAGAAGARYLERGEPVRSVPAAPLPGPGVDSSGAGDAFVSGFLFGFLAGEPMDVCARLGAIAGAHACTVASTDVAPITRAGLLHRAGLG